MGSNGNIADIGTAVAGSKNAVENNFLEVLEALFDSSKQQAEYQCYTSGVCDNLSDDQRDLAIYEQTANNAQKIVEPYEDAVNALAVLGETVVDFTPIIGDAKAFADAQDSIDVAIAAIGVIPGVGDTIGKLLKEAKAALKTGDATTANKLYQEAQQLASKSKDDVSALTPTGSKGNVLDVSDGLNKPGIIGERQFSGHALDRMQRQGITPTAVENAINPQNAVKGKISGTTAYHDKVNNITVITDTKSGRVITVDFGIIKQ